MAKGSEIVKSHTEILATGAKDLDSFLSDYQALALVLDCSGSMGSSVDYDDADNTSKSELQRAVVKEYLRHRLGKKLGDMKVTVIGFNSSHKVYARDSSDLAALERAVDQTGPSSDTFLAPALISAMGIIVRSLDYIPRIVVTSDGAIHDPDDVMRQVEMAKSHGVIIDTIFIGPEGQDDGAAFLASLSEATGGVAERVKSSTEFKQKFLKVLDRKLITSGSMK